MSFQCELNRSQADVITVQETHFATKSRVKIHDFFTFEAIRKVKTKEGTMIAVHSAQNPVVINKYNEKFELLTVVIRVADREM